MLDLDLRLHRPSGFELQLQLKTDAAVTVLYGASGAGKTTVLDLISGACRPDRGHVRIDGVELFEPQLVGQLDAIAVRQALLASQGAMAQCRRPNQTVRVRVQVHINLNQILLAAPATPQNSEEANQPQSFGG